MTETKSKPNRKRDKYIGCWVTEEERDKIAKLADKEGTTKSNFIRKRLLEGLTNNQLAYIFMEFMARKISESSISPDKKIFTKHKLEELKAKLVKPLDISFAGMSKEQKDTFEKHWAEKSLEYCKLAEEINDVLKKFFVEE